MKPFENILVKGENAGYQLFLFYTNNVFYPCPQKIQFSTHICHLQMLSIWTSLTFLLFGKELIHLN